MEPLNVAAKFEVRSFTLPGIIGIGVLGGVASLQCREMVLSERAFLSSCRPSIVSFALSLRVSEILTHLCSSTPLFPTPPLVSPKFPYVPLWVGGWPLGYEERRCWTNGPWNWFPRFPAYVILIHQRYRRTDRRATCSHKTALCTKLIVHRAIKIHCAPTYNASLLHCDVSVDKMRFVLCRRRVVRW